MQILSISLKNFRNYQTANIQLDSGINLLLGDNAQGKTSLLEAMYLCSIGKSFRTARDRELIKSGSSNAQVQVRIQNQSNVDSIEIRLDNILNKHVAINSMPITRLGELMGVCNCVLFSPDELKIVKEGPSERRRFVDIALCQISKTYFYLLQNFNKVLSQRNKLLKTGKATADDLYVWDVQLVEHGAKITKTRRGFVDRLAKFAKARHDNLSNNKENLQICYSGIDGLDLDCLKDTYLLQLKADRLRDQKHGYTHSGPHKDDLDILINDIDARTFGSQGQQRSAALSLKLAQADIVKQHTGQSPILLLDDVLSELDANRCIELLQFCSTMQTVITATHIEKYMSKFLQNATNFRVQKGKLDFFENSSL
jgi:DNA replication and repair protein RecF